MAWGKVKDEDFIGKEAHLRHREEEPAAVMCSLTVDDHTSKAGVKRYMLGKEPILTLVVIPAIYAAVKSVGLPEARSRATPAGPPANSRRLDDVEVPEGAK